MGADDRRLVRALVCREFGGEALLRIEPWPAKVCKPHQVRIATRAAAANFGDTLMIRGEYAYRPEPPFIPGHEIAGEVTEVGSEIRGLAVGDRVLTLCGKGGFCEEVVVGPPRQQVHRIPNGMPWEEAAAFNLSYGTAAHALRQRTNLWHGEVMLVLGATGATGSAAVQVGKALGATVIAAASGARKCRVAHGLGADLVIDSTREDLPQAVYDYTRGRGADVVFDPVGGSRFADAERCVAWNGRWLVVGFAGGEIPNLPMHRTILKGISVVGISYAISAVLDPARNADDFAWLFDAYERGALRPRIDSVFPLGKAADALVQVRERSVTGRVVVDTTR